VGSQLSAEAAEQRTTALMGPFSEYLGLDLVEASGKRVMARWRLDERLHQPFGIVHGGAYAAVVETVGSVGANLALGDGARALGVHNAVDFLRASSEGVLDVVAVPVHQGRTSQLWRVDITDGGRLVAQGNLRMQNLVNGVPADRGGRQ
jgi:1,4-dihydroxy-2-naphthoyl-CoA hydrolase